MTQTIAPPAIKEYQVRFYRGEMLQHATVQATNLTFDHGVAIFWLHDGVFAAYADFDAIVCVSDLIGTEPTEIDAVQLAVTDEN